MPKEVDSFIYGVDKVPDWAYGKVACIWPRMKEERFIDENGVEKRKWLWPDDLGPISEGSLLIRDGMKIALFDNGEIVSFVKGTGRCLSSMF